MTECIETDVLVVGSGAGGLTAALTAACHNAKVLVVEKGAFYGGTSALSGVVSGFQIAKTPSAPAQKIPRRMPTFT